MLWGYKNEFLKELMGDTFLSFFFTMIFVERALEPLGVITTSILWLKTHFYMESMDLCIGSWREVDTT